MWLTCSMCVALMIRYHPGDEVHRHVQQEPPGLMGQHLFSVYVHPGPRHPGYPIGNLFHGREVPNRVQVGRTPVPGP